jgi:L-ascorbate metabolism protein UlaG (beta-lactamase superfamily)
MRRDSTQRSQLRHGNRGLPPPQADVHYEAMLELTLIRNATLLLNGLGRHFLVDPMLRDAGTTPPIDNTPNARRNPLVPLPLPADEIVAAASECIVTHLHCDHFDDTAVELLPDDMPILTHPASAAALRERGFNRVSMSDEEITLTDGRHGIGETADKLGPVCGFVYAGVYVAGDTILCDQVLAAIERHRPRTIVVNGSGARFLDSERLVMDVADVRRLREAYDGEIVVVHLEAMNHCLEPRALYREISGVRVPDDGERLTVAAAPASA